MIAVSPRGTFSEGVAKLSLLPSKSHASPPWDIGAKPGANEGNPHRYQPGVPDLTEDIDESVARVAPGGL